MPRDQQAAAMTAGQIGQRSGWIGHVQMDDVRRRAANLAHHPGAHRRRRQVEQRPHPGQRDPVDIGARQTAPVAGHHHLDLGVASDLAAQRLQMGLDAAHVRRVELADLEDAHELGPVSRLLKARRTDRDATLPTATRGRFPAAMRCGASNRIAGRRAGCR